MSVDNASLMKAGMKSLAHHFKKSAAHHEKMADHHEKCMKAHEAAAEHHDGMMNDGDADDKQHKAHHKAKAAFHKSMAGHHEKLHKAHKAHAEHHASMHESMNAEEANKVLKLAGLEELPVSTQATPAPVVAAPAATSAAPEAAPVAPAVANLNETINKALENKLNEAVNAGLERVLASDQFSKRVDEAISNALLGKLGQTTVPTTVQTFAVPRSGETQTAPAASSGPTIQPTFSKSGVPAVDPDLADLVSM